MNSINIMEFVSRLFFGLMDAGLMLVWSMLLFNLGTLLQKNKEVLAYFNILGTDAADHLIDKNSSANFNPSNVISTMGLLLKIYAIGIVAVEFLSIFEYMF